MKKLLKSLSLCLLLLFTGCVPSLNPLYTEKDLIFDHSLIGIWTEDGTGESWAFSNCDELSYTLVHTDVGGKKGKFDARLVKVADKTFLDITPADPQFTQNDFYRGHFFSTHTFVYIVQKGPTVKVAILEPKWLKEVLAENPNAIRHERIQGEIVLASSPEETQKFLLANLNTREAFSQPIELKRKNGGK